uniref:AAA+ ATPase domain-containing protein n=1 Tax=Aegilops tauschii subsp. strangulata TaxID=200361 RepID=A0A453SY86_AEGTS
MEQRIVTQLMTCMDQFHQNFARSDGAASEMDTSQSSDVEKIKPAEGYVVVIGATNRPDAVDRALRRPGRFDREICVGVPDEDARRQILEKLTRSLRTHVEGGQFDLDKITRVTPGFVGADLKALVDQAGSQAIDRFIDVKMNENGPNWWRHPCSQNEMESLSVTMDNFEEAIKMAQPSLRREGFSSVPDVKWADVGGLDSLKQELDRCIVRCIKHPELYKKFGVDMQDGFLLFGPPGCGKTLIAKAVAHDAGANFIYKKGPELLTKYVGESESGVRKIFAHARTNSPCIIFFDEIDALTAKRGNEGAWVVERVVNQLLTELGSSSDQGVFVIGATNRIDVIDDALLRPNRFGRKHFVPLPGANERASILKSLASSGKKPLSPSVDLDALARREECNNLPGADLLTCMLPCFLVQMNEAAMEALEDRFGVRFG